MKNAIVMSLQTCTWWHL